MAELYEIPLTRIDGSQTTLAEYRNKVLLIVNTASQCGFTPQYAGLEALYRQYKDQGLVVLGFPCNQFGAQEPASEAEIKSFCDLRYGVSFPIFAKVEVNGQNTHPLFALLKKNAPGVLGTEGIKWNFTKFLVDSSGSAVARFAPVVAPADLDKHIDALLAAAA